MAKLTESEQAIITKYDLYFEGRVSRLEANNEMMKNDMKEVKNDLRWLIGIMLGGFAGLFAMMAHGFHWF